jgi:hypothetical protein
MPQESAKEPAQSLDEIADELFKIFSDPKTGYTARRYWLFDPERQVFYRDPLDIELEKAFDEACGIEHWDEGDAPRPAC